MVLRFLMLLACLMVLFSCNKKENEVAHPNIIYILADDLGYGDVAACNPASKIQTPHIDALAQQGILFSDVHSGSAVCTPTRYGVLTGRYSWRTRLQQGVLWSYDTLLIDPARTTVATLLKKQGYHTACIGKWHLGLGWQANGTPIPDLVQPISSGPNDVGFDESFIIPASLDIPPYFYLRNDRVTSTQVDTIDATTGLGFWRRGPIASGFSHEAVLPDLTKEAVQYIQERGAAKDPFFLYLPLPAPHTPVLPVEAFQGKSAVGPYGDFVMMVDDVVRQIVEAVAAAGLTDNTLIIFTSDNGCAPAGGFKDLQAMGHDPSAGFRGHKADIYEGGHRIPFIAKWPAKVKAGSRSDETLCLTDLLATVADITGMPLKDDEGEDSYSFLPVLLGKEYPTPLREATVHHSVHGAFAIRKGKWKLIFSKGSGGWSYPTPAQADTLDLPPLQLYDLSVDRAEQQNVSTTFPDTVQALTTLMQKLIQEGRSTPGTTQKNEVEVVLMK